jgi:RimJ/RimL family protein N-acetyltransferase
VSADASLTLVSVYDAPGAEDILYRLLQERTDEINISHRAMPRWEDHIRFVASRPYSEWYLIEQQGEFIGSIYLSRQDEIGIFIFRARQGSGLGRQAIAALIARHPRKRYLANINPANHRSIAFFQNLGFRHIQNTYALE